MRGEDRSLILLRAGLHIQVSLKSFNEMSRGDHRRLSVSKLADAAAGNSGRVSTEDTGLPEEEEEELEGERGRGGASGTGWREAD